MPTQWPWRVSHDSFRAAAMAMGMHLDVLLASPQCCTRMEVGFITMTAPSGSGMMGRWHDHILSPWHATDPVPLVLAAAQTRATHPWPLCDSVHHNGDMSLAVCSILPVPSDMLPSWHPSSMPQCGTLPDAQALIHSQLCLMAVCKQEGEGSVGGARGWWEGG